METHERMVAELMMGERSDTQTEPSAVTKGAVRAGTRVAVAAVFWIGLAAAAGAAHPVSVTEAVVYVQREKVSVKIDVFVEDLFLFHHLKPDAANRLPPDEIARGRDAHGKFLLERFQLRDAAGELLHGVEVGVDGFTMPDQGISLDDLMTYSYGFRFEYPLDAPLEFITISQKLVDETAGIPAEMQLRVKQEGSESPYYAVLNPNQPVTVRFNWESPPLSPSATEEEWEQWLDQRRSETLGITSYSSVYSFLYITDHEVRHEILAPLATLEASVMIPRRDEAFLEVDEQPEAGEQLAAFFGSGNPVEIDGKVVTPVVNRVDFYGVDFRDFAQQAPKRKVSMANARVGIILSYPTVAPPQEVSVTWNRFNRYIFSVRSVIYAYDQTEHFVFARYGSDQTFHWTNPGRPPLPPVEPVGVNNGPAARWEVPAATLVCLLAMPLTVFGLWWRGTARFVRLTAAGVWLLLAAGLSPWAHVTIADPFDRQPPLSLEEKQAIFERLHANLYRAFDFTREDDVYDALSRSVDGPFLQQLYVQVRKSLAMQEQGGAQSRIQSVRIVEQHPRETDSASSPGSFAWQAKWTLEGTVEHWGHIHARTNQYEAVFHIAPRDHLWKITGIDMMSEERINFDTRLRGL